MSATHSRTHGGPDALGVPRHDFSTNSNACGPYPAASQAVQQADASHYPDPSYHLLRQQLADFHGVASDRILLAGSASEFIFRITASVALRTQGQALVYVAERAYGDYALAAQAWGLSLTQDHDQANLVWTCEPSSPLGTAHGAWPACLDDAEPSAKTPTPLVLLDRAYEPLRLQGECSLNQHSLAKVWQLWTPNKALGMTGVRAAYAIAPTGPVREVQSQIQTLESLNPSWPIGAHGLALLQCWVQDPTQAWLVQSRQTLQVWKDRLTAILSALDWTVLPSQSNFLCARPQQPIDPLRLRQAGIKLRDASSLGLPGFFRLGVLPPESQDALRDVLARPNESDTP
jgi:histidinol-phosphate aminotransferase